MIAAGCDVGALTAKAVVIEDKAILGSAIIRSRADSLLSATAVMDRLLEKLGLSHEDIDRCLSTGYGRNMVPFAHANLSEVSCHGMGAVWLVPSVRTIIDGGGQDYKILKVDQNGLLKNFCMTGRCAAGTGRAMELMAESLGVDVSEIGALSVRSANPLAMNSACSVLTAVKIKHYVLSDRFDTADIAAGITWSAARQVRRLVNKMEIEADVAITGGIAKNIGVLKHLREGMGMEIVEMPVDPQLIGAVGAAVFAADQLANPDSWK